MNDQDEGSFKAPPPPKLKTVAKSKPPIIEKKPEEKTDELECIAEMAPQPNLLQNLPPPIDYVPPHWASEPAPGICEAYKFEILKNGTVVSIQDFEKRNHNPTFVVIGRLPNCDVVMEHPSVSRYHCILQYGDDKMDKKGKGWFIFDMGSTHGTKMNKNRVPPKQFIRLQVGFVLQFGNSTRICSLLGPAEDAEPEWDISPTEMKEKMKKRALEAKLAAAAKKEFEKEQEQEKEDEGINWGMDYGEGDEGSTYDLDGEADGEAYYNTDPKKALTKFFERVGFEMNFTYTESGAGHNHKWICSIEFIASRNRWCGSRMYRLGYSKHFKKDATVQCALEACRILDRHGALRGGSSRFRIKKKNLEENDYYDEDDDLFFDRTGQLEAQRDKRKLWTLKAMGQATEERDTYETLTIKLNATRGQMAEIQSELDELGANKQAGQAADVDDYVNQLSKGKITVKDDMQTKIHKSTLRQKLVQLTHEAQTLEKLCKITKPVQLPDLKAAGASSESANKQAFLRKMMKFGNVKKELADVEAKVVIRQTKVVDETAAAPIEEKQREPEQETPPPAFPSTSEDAPKVPSDPVPEQLQPSTSSETSPRIEQIDEHPLKSAAEVVLEDSQERKRPLEHQEEVDEAAKSHKKRKPRIRKEKWDEYGAGCDTKDEQYATWMPPDNQSGDGTTSLNAKFAGRY